MGESFRQGQRLIYDHTLIIPRYLPSISTVGNIRGKGLANAVLHREQFAMPGIVDFT